MNDLDKIKKQCGDINECLNGIVVVLFINLFLSALAVCMIMSHVMSKG